MNIELNDQELDIIMRALMAQPYGAVVVVVNTLVAQANAQRAAAVPAAAQ
jgi:hypothetical protein